ncbi:MAG: 5-dehydro-2-deoxygluconokinase [Pseudomonadota bacterium]
MRVLNGIKGGKFLVVGRVGMDFCPDPPGTPVQLGEVFVAGMGGSAANTAAGLVKLGQEAALVTCVSDDAVGDFCRQQLKNYDIDDRYVRTIQGEERTSLAVYESRLEDHKTVIYRNNAADFRMDLADVEAVDYGEFTALITAGTVFAAEPSRAATFRAFELARAAGIPIIFDVDYRPYSWSSAEEAENLLGRAAALSDVIVGNDEEFGFIAGDISEGLNAARKLAEGHTEIVVYKRGPEGAVTLTDNQEIITGIYPIEALKPTGAGDSFMAGFLASIAQGHALKEAILRGSACASIVVSKVGCAPAMPYPDELEAFLRAHPGPTSV